MTTILKKDRKEAILKLINIHSRVTFNDLSRSMEVSEDTIRRDLNELASESLISKIRGGAMAKGNQYDSSVTGYAMDHKLIIAQKAVSMIQPGMLVIVGGGTSTRQLIKLIPDDLEATFLTGNPFTCIELMQKPNIETILLGGRVSGYSQTVTGGEIFQTLSDVKADLCIMGTNAIDAADGLTDSEWESVPLKKAMARAAKKIVVLAISEKLNTVMKLRVISLKDIDYLVTELPPDDALLAPYKESGIEII